ncbi:Cysteine--tRNA ligase [Orchesella cincta]|uniref:Cysteine--tRNA ligase n=1 Tax=Orchesella cincta TaxID=48709 RepID=A0A1D2M8H8_ORCCI|nr:Cysteine--tRNA ligase [Orchesella cincta]
MMAIYNLFAFAGLFISSSAIHQEKLQWVDNSDAYVSHLIPAGGNRGGYGVFYVAREKFDGNWVPGKTMVVEGILTTPPGATSWVRAENASIPAQSVVVDEEGVNDEETFICRALHRNDITPGKLLPSVGLCQVPYVGLEYSYPEYEVLVINDYGLANGVGK